MIDLKQMNDNPLSRAWKRKYNNQPVEIKKKLDLLEEMNIKNYQLKIIKRKRLYPQIGDIFLINPKDDIFFWGIVANNHINSINGEDLITVMIFNEKIIPEEEKKYILNFDNLLISPSIVGKEYWTRGYFYSVDNINLGEICLEYGFYDIISGKYCDEYGKELTNIPRLLGTYGVSTISGIAYKINQELIIAGLS